ncbi:hypothetical protein P3875_02955 [Myroides sp. JBRI-B21084]|uniref:hypothetical protein n=1 Tax=Myroides sp. JBRI-B21084 TaxID=3119977 RepID=UPI0026E394B5|nr:hypothetical protein [Paenimyroides cloacae]WKW47034.1 hypothetical protein P3875_02955 [Paenimyroides cloacae]
MKFFKTILSIMVISFISGCSENTLSNGEDDNVNPFPEEKVNVQQTFSYKNKNGEGLFDIGEYKTEYLSLIATDENFNDLYINGQLVADIVNISEIRSIGNNSLDLFFGRTYAFDEPNKSAIAYYKLKYNENKYDTITVHYYYSLVNGTYNYITSVNYNGTEYPAQDIIEIIK